MKHGTERYYFKGEGWTIGALIPAIILKSIFRKFCPWYKVPRPDPVDPDPDDPPSKPRRVFCRLFGEGTQQDADGLIELGMAMETETQGLITAAGDSNIPAGYTYLGQFVDHDITSDPTRLTSTGMVDPSSIMNQRTPALDLDCVYGAGPGESGHLYEADGVHMKVGRTSSTDLGEPGAPIDGNFPNDLPRGPDKKALIGDPRNDENLPVAQTHLAFIKYHNKKVDEIKAANPALSSEDLFKAARQEVVHHYQSIVLTDLLPRIADKDVVHEVLSDGPKFYNEEFKGCMPIEFSVAAYRLGHSMVRPVYQWNKVFSTTGVTPATMELLFEFSEFSGSRGPGDDPFFGKPTLPSNWIVDWRRFYDFSNVDGVDSHPQLNLAREIDSKLSFALKNLPEFQAQGVPPVFASLATRNLLRGRLLNLPTGQQVAQAMQDAGVSFTPLTAAEITAGPHEPIITRHGFHEATPLWYYILKEAKVRNDGNKLGPVGSRIVAEVFVGLTQNSPTSVLRDRPDLHYSMPELLHFVGDLNPLGD